MVRFILNKLFWGVFRHLMSDKHYAKFRYWLNTGKSLNLKNPRTFSEKIQYLKFNDRTELRKKVADRTLARTFVEERIGKSYLIPIIGSYQEMDQKVWDSLPPQFVLKANHGSGMIKIIKDKSSENLSDIIQLTEKWKKTDYAGFGREWVYKGLPRTIVAEELLLTSSHEIPEDFKFFCFHGKVEIIQIDFDRFKDQRRKLFDRNYKPLDAQLLYKNYPHPVAKHPKLDHAIEIAEKLSEEFIFMRVDLYLIGERIYFGEMTNFPGNGFIPFEPYEYELKFGSLMKLEL